MLNRRLPTAAFPSRLPIKPDPMCPQCGDPLGRLMYARRQVASIEIGMKCEGCATTWETSIADTYVPRRPLTIIARH